VGLPFGSIVTDSSSELVDGRSHRRKSSLVIGLESR
jgi:hypothetical protein